MPDDAITSRMWWILAAMGAILGVILLDETVVGVALPTIQTDLAMTEVGSHWVVNIYMLALAALAAAAGKFGDMVGHRALMIAGLLVFGLASLACGFSQTGTWLIVARGIQGVGAAIIFPSSLAMITIIFPESRRGLALGVYGAIGTTFLALGPFVGGLLTDLASWRWIFWINPPIVLAVALVVLVKWNIDHAAPVRQRFDRAGFLALAKRVSLCTPYSSICKHWKRVCVDGATRAALTGDRGFYGVGREVRSPDLIRRSRNDLYGGEDIALDKTADGVVRHAERLGGLQHGQPFAAFLSR